MGGFLGNSGLLFRGLNPRHFRWEDYRARDPEQKWDNFLIFYEDVVPPLTRINRYNGHTPSGKTVSVAQHLLAMCDVMEYCEIERNIIKHALIHDLHEAYIGDITTDMKGVIDREKIKSVSEVFDTMIYSVIGIEGSSYMETNVVTSFDLYMLYLERKVVDGDMFREDIWGEFRMHSGDEEYILQVVENTINKDAETIQKELSERMVSYGLLEVGQRYHCKIKDLYFYSEGYRFPRQHTLVKVFQDSRYIKTIYTSIETKDFKEDVGSSWARQSGSIWAYS